MSDYKEILTSDRVYKKYKSIIPDTNVSIDDIIQKLSYFYKISIYTKWSVRKIQWKNYGRNRITTRIDKSGT